MSEEPPAASASAVGKVTLGCLGLVIIGVFLFSIWVLHPFPSYGTFSGPIGEEVNTFTEKRIDYWQRVMQFSPDSKYFAYFWRDQSYVRPAGPIAYQRTLAEKVGIRVRAVAGDKPELSIPVDEVDFRPDGAPGYHIGISLQWAPDSRRLAVICSRRLVLLDLPTSAHRSIEFQDECFGGFAWWSSKELAFSTVNSSALRFWRYDVKDVSVKRTKLYEERYIGVGEFFQRPPPLRKDQWSPNGRFVTVLSIARRSTEEDLLVDLQTGATHLCPYVNSDRCWKRDSSAVILHDAMQPERPTILMDPITGQFTDLTPGFEKEFGEKMHLTWFGDRWTSDDKHVLVYNTPDNPAGKPRGCLVQPYPFKVIVSSDHILRGSPVPGWVLVEGDKNFKWMDYSGEHTAPIEGRPSDWTWADDGHHAAKIALGHMEIFAPQLPGDAKTK